MIQKAFRFFIGNAPEPFVVGRMLFRAVFGNEIGHARTGDRRFEFRRLRNGPLRHIATVGPPADAETIRVGDTFLDQIVDTRYDVPVVRATPIGAIALDEFFAITYRTANIGIKDGVAARDEKLAPWLDDRFPRTGRTPVDE